MRAKTRLLLVDDNRDNLEILTLFLEEEYTVFGCGSAAEALRAVEAVKPHGLVLDIGMSPMDGVQCLEAIRAIPGYGGIPAIALTAFARDVERQKFVAAGFQAVVTKPILEPAQLLGIVEQMFEPRAASA